MNENNLAIKEIEYSELKTGNNYNNQKFSARIEILPGQNLDEVYNNLVLFVKDKLNEPDTGTLNTKYSEMLQKYTLLEEKYNAANSLEWWKTRTKELEDRAAFLQKYTADISNIVRGNYEHLKEPEKEKVIEGINLDREYEQDIPPF